MATVARFDLSPHLQRNTASCATLHVCRKKLYIKYTVTKVLNYLIVNVYLPCVGSVDRWLICSDIFADIQSWCDKFDACEVIVAGDFNCDLTASGADKVSDCVLGFVSANSLIRCDSLFPLSNTATYINYALNHQSYIDYVFTSTSAAVNKFEVHDPDVIFF